MTVLDSDRKIICNTDEDVLTWHKFDSNKQGDQYAVLNIDVADADGNRDIFYYI